MEIEVELEELLETVELLEDEEVELLELEILIVEEL